MNFLSDFGQNIRSNLSYGKGGSRRAEPFFSDSQSDVPSVLGRRFGLFLRLAVVLAFFIFLSTLIILQIFEGGYNLNLSRENRLQEVPIKAERGLILGSDGGVLAGNAPSFDLYYSPQVCLKKVSDACDLSPLAGYSFYTAQVQKELADAKEVYIVRDLPQAEALDLEQKISGRPYLRILAGQVRDYKMPEAFFHVLGYVSAATADDLKNRPEIKNSDKVGRLGLEAVYDDFLRGQDGGEVFESDAQGNILRETREVAAVPGGSLILNINEDLQKFSYGALSEGVKGSKAAGGAVVVEDVESGAILTLLSYPSVNANIFSSPVIEEQTYQKLANDPNKPFFDRAVSGAFPPGSVFKLAVAAAALTQKTINASTIFEGPGAINIGSFVYRDWKPQGHGELSLVGAIKESCDTCFYAIGGGYESQKGAGGEAIASEARLFGFGSLLGIDLPGENSGLVPDAAWKEKTLGDRWYLGDTYHLAIGQGFMLSTPLQIAAMTSVIANGGTLYKPYIVSQIKDPSGNLLRSFAPKAIRKNILAPQYLDLIRQGMKAAASPGGTAYPFFNFPIPVAGKTGTAENGQGGSHAWFTVYAPFDKPKVAVTVFLENGGEGSANAAPVAKRILQKYFNLPVDGVNVKSLGFGD